MKLTNNIRTQILAGLAVPLCTMQFASAALSAIETFSYPVGPLSGQNSSPSGFSGAWGSASANGSSTVTSGSLISPVAAGETGNKATLAGAAGGSAAIFRQLNSSLTTGTHYVGFTFRVNTDSIRTAGLSLYSGTTTERLFIGMSSIPGNADRSLRFAENGVTTPGGGTATAVTTGQTYQLVLRVDFDATNNNERLRLFVDQATEGVADGDANTVDLGTGGFDTIRLFAGGAQTGINAQIADFDGFRIATTYGEALAIPEPSAVMLLGSLGCFSLLLRRRS